MVQTLTKPSPSVTASSRGPTSTVTRSVALSEIVSSKPLMMADPTQKVDIQWLASGKPVLSGVGVENVDISLSHDDQVCLCVVGQGPQGCDIVPLTERTRTNWLALLTAKHGSLLQELISSGDSLDIAGSRIWAAMEALLKAIGTHVERSLTIEQRQGDTVLFNGEASNQSFYLLTFPIQLSYPKQRMVALVVTTQG